MLNCCSCSVIFRAWENRICVAATQPYLLCDLRHRLRWQWDSQNCAQIHIATCNRTVFFHSIYSSHFTFESIWAMEWLTWINWCQSLFRQLYHRPKQNKNKKVCHFRVFGKKKHTKNSDLPTLINHYDVQAASYVQPHKWSCRHSAIKSTVYRFINESRYHHLDCLAKMKSIAIEQWTVHQRWRNIKANKNLFVLFDPSEIVRGAV